ncbi:phosphorylase [Bacteroidia bacterium]|nr:phosphorylase [Bacteroidia bacterium]
MIPSSELIINSDGSIFHLHLQPHQLADTIILVGDPSRVEVVASRFSKVHHSVSNREFVTQTGEYKGHPVTALATGIGTDNLDIVINELDALANIDLATREPKAQHRQLTLLRLGTSGALQPDIALGSYVSSHVSIGFDGLLNFYAHRNSISLLEMERAFCDYVQWNPLCAKPYFAPNSERLIKLFADSTVEGMTAVASGFYGPQGRVLRLPLADPKLNEKIAAFRYQGKRITNFEMEGSAIAGLGALLGHETLTICTIIANRAAKDMNVDYKKAVDGMIDMALAKLFGA